MRIILRRMPHPATLAPFPTRATRREPGREQTKDAVTVPSPPDPHDSRFRPFVVVVCGSRTWTDRAAINARVAELPPGSIVIQGEADGADRIAKHAAALANLHCCGMPAMWRNGRGAGPARNRAMLDLRPDLVIAFQRNNSRGTQHTIDEARRRGVPVEVHNA